MAAKTPTTIKQENLGSITLLIADFDGTVSSNDIDDGDTWASGINNSVSWWFAREDDPTTQTSVGVAVAESSGTFTFHAAEDGVLGKLHVLAKNK